jgi:hypothetical protein
MKALIYTLLTALTIANIIKALETQTTNDFPEFAAYIKDFNKTYNDLEYKIREEIYNLNV